MLFFSPGFFFCEGERKQCEQGNRTWLYFEQKSQMILPLVTSKLWLSECTSIDAIYFPKKKSAIACPPSATPHLPQLLSENNIFDVLLIQCSHYFLETHFQWQKPSMTVKKHTIDSEVFLCWTLLTSDLHNPIRESQIHSTARQHTQKHSRRHE